MRKAVEELIKNQQHSNHCFICDAKLTHINIAEAHYNSKRHQDNVKAYRKKAMEMLRSNKTTEVLQKFEAPLTATQKETLHCNICNVRFGVDAAGEHYKEDEHKKKEEAYCNVCSILMMSKEQLWEHMHGSRHKNKLVELGLPALDVQYSPFDQALPINVKKMMLADVCQICDVKFRTMKQTLDHYSTQKHKSSVQHWFKERKQSLKLNDNKTNKNISRKDSSLIQQKSEAGPVKVVQLDFNCFVCKINVRGEATVASHRTNFPHTELAKLKSDMVAQGIIEEYWVRQGNTIYCALCNVRNQRHSDAIGHFNSTDHYVNFHNWCRNLAASKVPAESDTKWFYCRICDKPLDGTSDSEKHYLNIPHQKKSQLYCKICDVPNKSWELLEIHNTTTLHNENLKKLKNTSGAETVENNKLPSRSWYKNFLETKDSEAEETDKLHSQKESENQSLFLPNSFERFNNDSSKTTSSLKEQVFQEIDKLFKTLYISKTVPYDVALDYLRKVNREVENLKRKYANNDGIEISEIGAGSIDFERENVKHLVYDSEHFSGKDESPDNEFYSFNSDNNFPEETMSINNLIDFSEDLSTTKVQRVENVPEKTQSNINLIDFSDDFYITETNFKNYNNNEASYESDTEELGDNEQKVEDESYKQMNHLIQKEYAYEPGDLKTMLKDIIRLKNEVNENNIEIDVLTEIERLITLVDSDEIPLDIALMYLQKSNRELDLRYFGVKDKRGHIEESEPDGEYGAFQAGRKLKYRYSKEELWALRTERTFTERLNIHLRMILNEARIWNKHCNDLDLD